MERKIDMVIDEINGKESVTGVILTDHAGLCLGVKGDATTDGAGIVAAFADKAAKLEPDSTDPIISLQGVNRVAIKFNQFVINGKNPLDKLERSNVFYRLRCVECGATYMGQTKRQCIILRDGPVIGAIYKVLST